MNKRVFLFSEKIVKLINNFFSIKVNDFKPLTRSIVNACSIDKYLFETKYFFKLCKKYDLNLTKTINDFQKSCLKNSDLFKDIIIDKNGILNFNIKDKLFWEYLNHNWKLKYFATSNNDECINIEVISANPTGNLHIGHIRNGCFGRAIGGIYDALGYKINWNFYVNNNGKQMEILAQSVYYSYQKILAKQNKNKFSFKTPKNIEEFYLTSDVKNCAKELLEVKKDSFYSKSWLKLSGLERNKISSFAYDYMFSLIKQGVVSFNFEDFAPINYVYEKKDIIEKYQNKYNSLLNYLEEIYTKEIFKKYVYKKDNGVWLKTSSVFDEKDRIIIKSNKSFAYFLPDLIYHLNRYQKEFNYYLNIWGADHHGYIKRILSGLSIYDDKNLFKWKFLLIQLVKIVENNKESKMSKRNNSIISFEKLKNILSFPLLTFYLLEKDANSSISLNISKMQKYSLKNKFYYVKYAYVRVLGILAKCDKIDPYDLNTVPEYVLNLEMPIFVKKLCLIYENFENILNLSAKHFNPRLIIDYLVKISKEIHYFYEEINISSCDNIYLQQFYLQILIQIKRFMEEIFLLLNLTNMDKMENNISKENI